MAANYDYVLRQLTEFGLDVQALELGRIVRCRTPDDRRGQKSGWYALGEIVTEAGETLIVGSYGDWREGTAHKIRIERSRELSGVGSPGTELEFAL